MPLISLVISEGQAIQLAEIAARAGKTSESLMLEAVKRFLESESTEAVAPPAPAPPPPAPLPERPTPQFVFDPPANVPPRKGSGIMPKPAEPPRKAGTVLLVDDDRRIRMVFKLRIEQALGMTVIEAGDGEEGWQRIQSGGISLVVLDWRLPGLHGLEVLTRMYDSQIRMPVIVCSAFDQLKDDFHVKSYPLLRYLVKPISPDLLIDVIKEMLPAAVK